MANEKLTMTVDIRAQVNKFNQSMNEIKNSLAQTFSGKGIKNYTEEFNKIVRLMDKISLDASKPLSSKTEFNQMQKDISNVNTRIQRLMENLQGLNNLSFNERLSYLPEQLQENYRKATQAVDEYIKSRKALNNATERVDKDKSVQDIDSEINSYEKKLKNLQTLENKIASAETAKDKATAAQEEADRLGRIIQLRKAIEEEAAAQKQLNEVLKEAHNGNYGKIKKSELEELAALKEKGKLAPGKVGETLKNSNLPEGVKQALLQQSNDETKTAKEKNVRDKQRARMQANVEKNQAVNKEVIEATKKLGKESKLTEENINAMIDAQMRGAEASKKVEELKKGVEDTGESIEDLTERFEAAKGAVEAYSASSSDEGAKAKKIANRYEELKKELDEGAESYEENKRKREELIASLQNDIEAKKITENENLIKKLTELGITEEKLGDISKMNAADIKELVQALYDESVITPEVETRTKGVSEGLEELKVNADSAATSINKDSEAFNTLTERAQNIDQLTSRIKYFVGFAGVINVARKSLHSAIQTITELDKAMTQMAVVTKSTIADYWEQLPKYTERANKLGATIRDMYEADTLYYQQGLKANQVMQVANETMKMARIAGLSAAEATDRMTNALRGFNMEINEASAQKINDVYSKLAAITASNVDEISTAMTKTASIAHSAGMEFETTAAFLSQIIETTRESAETAGTALKTVIARFQELKKAPSEIGEVDGEIVDANKIEGALRTVGIALRDSEGQFRKLDDVFIELAGKWGELDKNTQRYIATIAAGSRQQSRFVALMQDYSHTVELVDAAYNSAGVSQEQYEKTLDSLQTKFNALKNAWDTFTMSLFDSKIVKLAVDAGKNIINVLNLILDKIDILDSGLVKVGLVAVSVNKLGSAFKIFTNNLKSEGGTIFNSIGAIGTAIKNSFSPKVISDVDKMGKAFAAFKATTLQDEKAIAASIQKVVVATNLDAAGQERLAMMLKEVNRERLTEEQLTTLCTIATDENATIEAFQNGVIQDGIVTQEASNLVDEKHLAISRKTVLQTKLESLAQSKLFGVITLGIGPKLADVAATNLQAGAYLKATAAMLGMVAALAAFVAIIYVVVKAIQKALSLRFSERLEDSQERLEAAAEATKECKNALEDLESEQDKYKSLHEELDKNIQGTEEWKKKLVECNDQVYDLIQKYPELVKYVQKSNTGELTIAQEGWDAVRREQETKLNRARTAQYSAQRQVYKMTQESQLKELIDRIYNAQAGTDAYSKGELRSQLDKGTSLESLVDGLHISIEDKSELLNAINEYQNSIRQNTSALEVLSKSLTDTDFENSFEQAGAEMITDAFIKQAGHSGTNFYEGTKDYEKYYKSMINDYGNFFRDYWKNSQFQEIAKHYGYSEKDFTGRDKKDLAKVYAAATGKEYNDDLVKSLNKNVELYLEELINLYLTDLAVKEGNESVNSMSAKDRELLGRFSQVSSLRMGDVDELQRLYTSDSTPEEVRKQIEEQLKAAGVNKFSQLYGKEFIKIMGENQLTSADLAEMAKSLTLDQLDDYARLIGRERAMGIGSTDFSSILSKPEGANILSELFSFDTSSIEDLELARKTLTDKWPQLTTEINTMIDQIIEFGGAVSKVDLDTLINRTKALASELAKLNEYQQGSVFSEEQMKKFIDNGVATEDDFLQTVDGNYVLVKPLETLTAAIKDNTDALNKKQQDLDNQYTLAEKYRNAQNDIKNNPYYNIDDFIKNNMNLVGSLGIAGVTENTNYDKLSAPLKEEIRNTIKNLGETMTQGAYESQQKAYKDALAQGRSSEGTAATNLADLFKEGTSKLDKEALSKAGILNIMEGEEGYNSLFEHLKDLREKYGEASDEYKDFLKTLSNKKDVEAAQKGMKNLVSTAQTFSEEYEKLGENTQSKMALIYDQARKFGLEGVNLTEDNYEMYAQLFAQFGEGNMDAYKAIANLMLMQQGATQEDIAAFWAGNLEITSDSLKAIAAMMQGFGFGFTEMVGDKAYLKAFNDMGGFVTTSGGGGADKWEDPYNWLWNINKRINKEIFERERLERNYAKAVEDTAKTEQDLYDISKKELQNLERQAQLERDKGTKAMQEAQMMMKQRADFAKYVSWDTTNGQIQVDYNSIDKLGWGSARGGAFEDFVGRLEELIDEVQDSQTTLEEIEDLTEDIKNRGREQYLELQDRIKNALVEINQRQIDTAEKINESIKTAQDELLNKIQEEISETRQIRSNQEKEQELEDKRQRLNYLRRDTTGANAVQIKQLEKELGTSEQAYTDSLTDQTLQNMQKANQKAEEQRQEQIDIMNNQLIRWQETGAIWETVNASIQEGFDNPDNFLNSQVGALLATAENKRALSELQQADWEKDLENQAKLAELFNNGQLYQQGEETLNEVRTCAEDLNREQVNIGRIGNLNQNVEELLKVYPKSYADKVSGGVGGIKTDTSKIKEYFSDLINGKKDIFNLSSVFTGLTQVMSKISSFFGGGSTTEKTSIPEYTPPGTGAYFKQTKYEKSATGGLNTYTGLAWLDGTPTKPEYVLNSDQTKAFFDLVDVLTSKESKNGISGDNYFDIDINVDELSNDYDVENVAEKIKQMIWEDSQYRNVNLVNLLR